jgi:diguanylate cyclase (GGDEF)-like protein
MKGLRPPRNRHAAQEKMLLDAVWRALNIARDNKALIAVRDGTVFNANAQACQLSGCTVGELINLGAIEGLFAEDPSKPDGTRWQSSLKAKLDSFIPVEVVHERLEVGRQTIDVYAIRDLREHQKLAAEVQRKDIALAERTEELRTRYLEFQSALTSLSQGLCVFDAQQRLVICNEPYLRMYGLSRDQVRPGISLREILQQRIDQGLYGGCSPEAFIAERLAALSGRRAATHTHHLPDGRIIDIGHHPMPEGGWVATHEDVTDRRSMAAALKKSNRELECRNQLMLQQDQELRSQNVKLDAALSSMFQGLAMFDSEERVVIANDRFAEMYGLTSDQVRPGTPLREIIQRRIAEGLYVGTTVDEVVQRMRERVARKKPSHMTATMGDGRTIAVSIQPRCDGGWVTTHQDITEHQKLNDRLERQNELLTQREEELKRQNSRFDIAVNSMSQGLCLFDADQRIVMANRRYAEIYSLTPEQVRPGTSLREVLEARAATGLYNNVDAAKFVREGVEGFRQKVSHILKLADGRLISVVRRPMDDGGLISTHEDITEREALHARVAEQREQLSAAMENMLQGVAMFDAEQRLIICNRRYGEMYGLTPAQVAPGTTVRQIFAYRLANGHYHVRDSESFVNSWMGGFGEVSRRVQELADGRLINVTRLSLANGGRLITHEDITERQKLSAQLEQQHGLLKQQEEKLRSQNVQLDAALSNMVQGLAMFDANHRIVIVNTRYAEMYGLTPDQVRPGTSFHELLQHRVKGGHYGSRTVEQVLEEIRRHVPEKGSGQYLSELADGRCIAVSVQSKADGGTVTTHQDITEQRRSEARIAHMALHDTLTGLANRALLNERLEDAIARAQSGEIVAVHLIDLDLFKNVNDTLGHPAGDKLLRLVSSRLRRLVREADTIARMGGDEFAIVQVALNGPADATSLAHRIIEAVSAPYEIDGHQVVIGASVGIAIGPGDGLTHHELMRSADLALYRAKGDGRGTFRFFEPEMDAQVQKRRALENDLRNALPQGEFELYYQPVVDLACGSICSLEALLRWQHPHNGLVAPDAFIPLAEETGLIIPLGEWVIRQACATAARWPDNLKVAVNLSPAQFRSPGLVQVIFSALATSGLAPDRLELEITESILLHDSAATLAKLYQLRELGVRIAMDDFGTGYSSLSYLQSFPFDKIKIDRSFVKDITESASSLNIVRAVAALAKGLGMTTTAEGVETIEQRDKVASEGCTEMQGFLFSRPLPAKDIERLILARGLDKQRSTSAMA